MFGTCLHLVIQTSCSEHDLGIKPLGSYWLVKSYSLDNLFNGVLKYKFYDRCPNKSQTMCNLHYKYNNLLLTAIHLAFIIIWQVSTKRKRHASKEQKEVPVAASNTTVSSKQTKMSNFERLIGRMQEEFPDVSRSGLVDVLLEIL